MVATTTIPMSLLFTVLAVVSLLLPVESTIRTTSTGRAVTPPYSGRMGSLLPSLSRRGPPSSTTIIAAFSYLLAIPGSLFLARALRSLSLDLKSTRSLSSPLIPPPSFRGAYAFVSRVPDSRPTENNGGYMVAFAGRKYAARSLPAFVANSTYTVTSFTLVLEFKKGRLQNLYWKRDGCARCTGNNNFVCLNNQDCAITTTNCKNHGGSVDCSLGIQLAFSGTDKHLAVLNSWYEVENLRQYSLFGLYSNLRDSLTSQYNKIF
ncbi:hypothetical protein GH714_037389 [Hevea brasiliensis]|uniref:Expp1 protein n=1 Tax=Hevea brasiliensis TaxID=3981 RepID=A0A6A6KQ93_HEVBR|nr:hypothetical protein GH714_037389 [Hevea brasiliensis]